MLVPGLFTARLDSATLQDDTIRDDRVAPCLGGSTVRRTLPVKLPIVEKNFNVGGLENLSCLMDTVITDPISRSWKSRTRKEATGCHCASDASR